MYIILLLFVHSQPICDIQQHDANVYCRHTHTDTHCIYV